MKYCKDIKKQVPRIKDLPHADSTFRQDLSDFLAEWFDASTEVKVHTSGSTGTPKELRVEKTRMMESACLTCSFLGLKAGDTALLCMPLKYIGAKMVVVRSLIAGLELLPVTPSGRPLQHLTEAPVFAAMTPMQVYNSLQTPEEKELLQGIRHLIIGGGAIDASLAETLKAFPHAVWSTYGMTETLSHIALRRLSGPEASDWYTPFESVHLRLSKDETLVIHAPLVCKDELTTNDIAELNAQGQFRIIGRRDNIINSGGVKIQIEQVEATLKPHLSQPFLIASVPDAKFGEAVVLLIEGNLSEDIARMCERMLPPYHRPKRILSVPRIPLTETGKPDRSTAKDIASRLTVQS